MTDAFFRPRPGNVPGLRRPCLLPLLLAPCLALPVWGAQEQGQPDPPKAFGPVEHALVGCPSVQGVYAWPPVEGEYAHGKIATNRTPWEGGLPVRIHGQEMQIWVQQSGGQLVMRSRLVNRARNLRTGMTRQWSLATYGSGQIRCTSNMLDMAPQDTAATNDYGGKGIRRGFRLARMKDGSLAVGIHTVSYGQTGSWFSWGGQSYGSYNLPDVDYWSWSKLPRLEPGDKEPAVVDAYEPGATRP